MLLLLDHREPQEIGVAVRRPRRRRSLALNMEAGCFQKALAGWVERGPGHAAQLATPSRAAAMGEARSTPALAGLPKVGMIRAGEGLAVPLRFPKRHEKLLEPEGVPHEGGVLTLLLRMAGRRHILGVHVILLEHCFLRLHSTRRRMPGSLAGLGTQRRAFLARIIHTG